MTTLIDQVGSKFMGAYNRLSDRLIESKMAIHTGGPKNIDFPDAKMYAYVAYSSIFKILDRMELGSSDVLVDIGCGKGRVVCSAATRQLRKVVGIDIDKELCLIASANVEKLRGRRSPVEIANLPAQEYDYRECTAFLLFNPFGEVTLRQTMESIEKTLDENPRPARIAYLNPVHENVLTHSLKFDLVERWERMPWSRDKFAVSFWTRKQTSKND